MSEEVIHLVRHGDSLGLTETEWACGTKKIGSKGYFGDAGTLDKITCKACKRTYLYREMKAKEREEA